VARASFVLTVAESKRLIAKAVAALPCVKRALEQGMVAICKGTTNGYVAEEILGRPIEKTKYITGTTQPAKGAPPLPEERLPDIVLRNGQPVDGLSVVQAIAQMRPGDVLIKGANALSPDRKLAGVLIGHPEGGTVGATLGHTYGRGIFRVFPVGLEKIVSADIVEIAQTLAGSAEELDETPALWPVEGIIVTEIEALEQLCGVRATQIAAGGIAGAEGAVRLLVEGERERVAAALALVREIHGEPPWAES